MSAHTKGPWAVNPACAQVDAMPSGLPICKLLWPTKERSEAETEANARLIAAAPDLLDALDAIHRWLVCAAIASAEDMAQSFEEMERIAARAIAKANGEPA